VNTISATVGFHLPWLWLLAPLGLLPLLRAGEQPVIHPWLALIPRDRLSTALAWALRSIACLAILALIAALARPYQPEHKVQRAFDSAQVVILLDRSRSMDYPYDGSEDERKYHAAARLLEELVVSRPDHLYAVFPFSTMPLYAMSMTDSTDAVIASLRATAGRGLSLTEVAAPLAMAIDNFRGAPGATSRAILLVSDGIAGIQVDDAARLRNWLRLENISVFWIQIPARDHGISTTPSGWDTMSDFGIPLPEFLNELPVPQRSFVASNADEFRNALQAVADLPTREVSLEVMQPQRELDRPVLLLAAVLLGLLLLLRALEVPRWR